MKHQPPKSRHASGSEADLGSTISGLLIERTAKVMKQAVQRKLKELNAGITVDQWLILDLLSRESGLSQLQIAEKTFKDPPTVTRIVELLSKKKLIRREVDREDKRRFKVYLTSSGQSKIQEILPTIETFRAALWRGLSAEKLEVLSVLLKQLLLNLEEFSTPQRDSDPG